MTTLPTAPEPPRMPDRDKDHLKLLGIFHLVYGALAILGIPFLFLHYTVMSRTFSDPQFWRNAKVDAPPKEFTEVLGYLAWVYVAFAVLFVLIAALNAISGFCLLKRKGRMFSMIVAGLDCIQVPFGTALGVFTIVVLIRPSVCVKYSSRRNG